MSYVLGHHQYGKAEVRVVRVFRETRESRHDIVDYNVSVTLTGDFDDAYLLGDQAKVLTTDACKNTVNAFAKSAGDAVRTPEAFARALADHFVEDVPQVATAMIKIEAYPWERIGAQPHAFRRSGGHVRTATVRRGDGPATVVSGLKDYVLLKTTDSEFHGFYQDAYTTLQPTNDRVMATSVTAQWAHQSSQDTDWDTSYAVVLDALTTAFADSYSYALQQTIWEMGQRALDAAPDVAEIRMSCPNKHHFVVDLSPFGLENDQEVFHADDRPYGLIEATVQRVADVDLSASYDPGQAWS